MKKNLLLIILIIVISACKKTDKGTVEIIPIQPTELKGANSSKDQIDLIWKDNSTNESGFKIERKTDSGNFTEIGSTPKDVTSFSDKTININTNYTYRVFSFNQVGKSILYSNEFNIKSINTPTLTTSAVSEISANGAVSGGNVNNDGGSPIIARGLVWSTNSNPTVALSTKTIDGAGIGLFQSSLSSLTLNTTYYVRAYATNSAGVGYGNEITFRTGPDITTGLTAYYSFNGNTNDESGNGNHGISYGNINFSPDRFNNQSKAYKFDGRSSYIDCPRKHLSTFTISLWFKTNLFKSYNPLIDSYEHNWEIYIANNVITYAGFQNKFVVKYYPTSTILKNSTWYNLTLIYNNSQIEIYLDGNKIYNNTVYAIPPVNGSYIIGASPTGGADFFDGELDDLRIYNKILTQEQISYLANNK